MKTHTSRAWVVLLISAVFEAVWATALGASNGFQKLAPTIVFLIFVVISSWGLAHAARFIPIGTAYAIWTGVGAALTVLWATLNGNETMTLAKAVCLTGIIGAAIGLKLVPTPNVHTRNDQTKLDT
jgi:quaternary ammonium compound-resistance protein SugE